MTPYQSAIQIGEQTGARLEIVGGIPTWEASPAFSHQTQSFRIQSSIRAQSPAEDTPCECVHVADVYIRFPDGSLKRPDLSVFCRTPRETKEAVTMLPEAVVEILSDGYEAKDLGVGVPFYLRMGVKDILVFDPDTGIVRHFRPGYSESQYLSPHTLTLACGCVITV